MLKLYPSIQPGLVEDILKAWITDELIKTSKSGKVTQLKLPQIQKDLQSVLKKSKRLQSDQTRS